jgi:hypothetical protein
VRNAKLEKPDEWEADDKVIARIALEDHPQILDIVGIFVKS